jgi:hypothetical protein
VKLLKTVIICDECQMPYYKAFWEPMWLAKLATKDGHTEWHDMALNPETTPLAIQWREWERDRIMQLLRSQVTKHYPIFEMHIDEIDALIKGEQK